MYIYRENAVFINRKLSSQPYGFGVIVLLLYYYTVMIHLQLAFSLKFLRFMCVHVYA